MGDEWRSDDLFHRHFGIHLGEGLFAAHGGDQVLHRGGGLALDAFVGAGADVRRDDVGRLDVRRFDVRRGSERSRNATRRTPHVQCPTPHVQL